MNTSKIIKGVVGGGRYTVTAPIIKEDYGLYLQIEGIELPETYEVDFSNDEHSGTSVTMIGNSDGVLIPSQFIKSGKDVFAFLYHVGADYGRTVFKFRIPNKLRPDRTDEEPTPEQASTIDQAINALNTAVTKTAQDVIDADASADRAEQAKDDASTFVQRSAQSAQASADYSESAQASAESASASASASAQSASQSAQIKTDVEGMADDAQGYADSARQSASQASASEQGCARAVLDAASAAAISRARAEEASGYAQTANTKASEASGYAQSASQKASEASQSASQALGYKTDAESAKTASQTAQGLAESAKADAITAKNDAESARDEAQNIVDGISGKVEQIDANTERIESLEDDRYKPYVVDSASGSIASFPDGADGIPLKSLVVDINPIQDLSHGDPSPENICPISGWTQVDVEQSGVNVFSSEIIHGLWASNGGFYSHEGRSSKYLATKTKILVVGGLTYHISYSDDADNIVAGINCLLWKGNDPLRQQYVNVNTGIISVPNDVDHITINFILTTQITTISSVSTGNFQLELGSTATPYEPYTGRSITIDLGQTVYGGKLDVLSGVLTVDMANIASYNGETLPSTWISDRDVYASGTTPTTGAQVVYQLATPLEIQLTSQQVSSLYGVNNIWADSGDTEAVYRADTKLFIERLTAPDSADMVADTNITSGKYFMVGNTLYKATANIANGASIIVGTNCIRKSLSEALNEINA